MVGDLGDVIRDWRNPLTFAQSKSYARQLFRGLEGYHYFVKSDFIFIEISFVRIVGI